MKAIAAIMLLVAVVCAAGCKKTEDPNDPNNGGNGGGGSGGGNNGGDPTPTVLTKEGIYLGIIGFNQNQYEKEIGFLNQSTMDSYISFIDGFRMENLTGLYYADYLALQRMQSCGEPPKLAKVALVTFTDGIDQTSVSPATPALNPEHYPSKEAYLEALNNKIKNEKVHGDSINAYTIGLKGTDALSNLEEFRHNLHMLASKQNNEYEADNMDEVEQHFAEIAESLYSETATASLKLLIAGGYSDGLELRFTFDDYSSPENSSLYIQCTFKSLGTSIRLENITYHGFKQGESAMESSEVENGFMKFVFVDLTKTNGELISEEDRSHLQMYKKTPAGWGHEEEFVNDGHSEVIPEQRSAIIMLVLDCTTSLGNESFERMKEAAKGFVETLVSSSLGLNKPTVATNTVSNVSSTSAICGGNVITDGGASVTARGVCWSSNQNPTISNHHTNDGTGIGSFNSNLTSLTPGKTYYVRAYATNSVGTSYGEQKTFTTLNVNMPTVTTNNVTNISQTSATCGGNVTSDGGATVTARGVCWSTSQNPTVSGSHTTDGTGTGSFTSNITGLTAGQSYYVRAYATNSAGTSYGEQKTINTISVPTVTTDNVTDIREQSAWCGGNVTSDGGATVTERGICWSTSSNPTINSSHISSGSGTGSFTIQMTGLSATTTYYVRAYAKNSAGVAYGEQKSFKTGVWLYYGVWEDVSSRWSVGEWAVMFPSSTISYYNGSITKIYTYCGMAGSYTLKIYKGGTIEPSTLLRSQSFNVTSEGWEMVELSNPLSLPNSTSLWVSISCSYSEGDYPAGAREGVYDENARWIYWNGSWVDIAEYNGSEDLCWVINVLISSSVKGEEGKEIQLPHSPNTQGTKETIKSIQKPKKNLLKTKLNK